MPEGPLARDEVRNVVEGKGGARRIPCFYHLWINPAAFGDRAEEVAALLERYPPDADQVQMISPDTFFAPKDEPDFRWACRDVEGPLSGGLDARPVIEEWSQFEDVLADWPDPWSRHVYKEARPHTGVYRVANWWHGIFERHWMLRGMNNALMDFYGEPENVHKLYRAYTDYHLTYIERAKNELNADAVLMSDDLGAQSGPLFSLDVFREYLKPYYAELFEKAHELGMHFWLHSCGNIRDFIPEWLDIGLDVLHPIQKYTMDQREIAETFGKDICIWAGLDLQQVIPFGTPEDVRREVRALMDTFYRPEGRLIVATGNGPTEDCPVASLEAMFAESWQYGSALAAEGANA